MRVANVRETPALEPIPASQVTEYRESPAGSDSNPAFSGANSRNRVLARSLMGRTVDEAFFVKCDRSTMTQDDIDNGRLICLVGVAPVRPAEYVIFRITQMTREA